VIIRDYLTKINLKRNKRNIQFHNFESAKSIGLLFSINNKASFDIAKNYYKEIEAQKKDAHALGFVKNTEELGQTYFGQGNFNFYSAKHFSRFGKIKENAISDFTNKEFDILINLSNNNSFYLEYPFALSKAKFKVSGIIDCKYSELNISYDKNKDLNYFISQVNYYLNTIKKA